MDLVVMIMGYEGKGIKIELKKSNFQPTVRLLTTR